ncbi:MAG: hypothetical protein AAFV95_07400 [Bacteroidota bacterium]
MSVTDASKKLLSLLVAMSLLSQLQANSSSVVQAAIDTVILAPLVQSQQNIESEQSASDYKAEVATKVLNELMAANGLKTAVQPRLVFHASITKGSWLEASSANIHLEERVYDLCIRFGPDSLNALANILARQLSILSHTPIPVNRLDGWAHLRGSFLAYTAGFNPLNISQAIVTGLHRLYGLEDKSLLDQRLEELGEAEDSLSQMIRLFEGANYLMVLNDPLSAVKYYGRILTVHQSSELYNNAGVGSARAAMSFFPNKKLKFAYPLEIDPDTRLKSNKRGRLNRQKAARERLLNNAMVYLQRAVQLDPSYVPGFLNMACISAMRTDYPLADSLLNITFKLAERSNNSSAIASIKNLRGIIAAGQKDEEQASSFFEEAIQLGHLQAQTNLRVLQNNKSAKRELSLSFNTEQIENISLDGFLDDHLFAPSDIIQVTPKTLFSWKLFADSRVLLNKTDSGLNYTLLHLTGPYYEGKTNEKIELRDSYDDMVQAYGDPARMVPLSRGTIAVYPKHQLCFRLDANQRITEWCVYRKRGLQ